MSRSIRSRPPGRAARSTARRRRRSTSGGRSSRRRPRTGRSAARRRPRWRRPRPGRPSAPLGPPEVHHHAGRGLVVGEGVHVDARGGAGRPGWVPGGDSRSRARPGGARRRRPPRTSSRELAEDRCWLRRSMRPNVATSQNTVRAAVAEHDLVAVGQANSSGSPAGAARRPLDRRLPVAGAEEACRWRPAPATASGRTLDGPHPNRPSDGQAGRAGIRISTGSDAGHCASMAAMARISRRVSAVTESATLAVDAKAKALKAAGEDVIGFGAGEPDFPTPAHIVEAAVGGLPRPAQPPVLAGGRAARAAGGHRGQDRARLGLRGRRRPGARHQRRQAGGRARRSPPCSTRATRCSLPAPYWTTYPEAIAPGRGVRGRAADQRRDRVPGHGRPARGGPHAADQGAAVRVAVQPDRRRVPPAEVEAIGRWAVEHGIWVVTDEIYEHLVYGDPVHHSMPAVVPELADAAWSSTAWPRPTP